MTMAHDYPQNDAFDFALPHAVGLAEAGQRLEQKRIGTCALFSRGTSNYDCSGFLFCAEVMPPTHELQLMLVNTLRKV
jgi:AP-4 complex subunit epsilon-1